MLGAAVGALAGYLISRVRTCSDTKCNVRIRAAYSIIAGAVFGAAVAWWLIGRHQPTP